MRSKCNYTQFVSSHLFSVNMWIELKIINRKTAWNWKRTNGNMKAIRSLFAHGRSCNVYITFMMCCNICNTHALVMMHFKNSAFYYNECHARKLHVFRIYLQLQYFFTFLTLNITCFKRMFDRKSLWRHVLYEYKKFVIRMFHNVYFSMFLCLAFQWPEIC